MDRLERLIAERMRTREPEPLAVIAAEAARSLGYSEEDPREEAAQRFFDPAFCDAFVLAVLDSDLPAEAKVRAADLAFDLVQLPRTEGEAFIAQEAIPAHLPRFAAFLAAHDRATAQHLLEVIYALHHRALAPTRLDDVPPENLARIAQVAEATDAQRVLFALLVVTYPDAPLDEALARFRAFVESGVLPQVARAHFVASLRSPAAFREALLRQLRENDLGSLDLDLWRFSLPAKLQKAADAWAPL